MAVEWKPLQYRSIETGELCEYLDVDRADNGRTAGKSGYFAVTVAPTADGFQVIANAPSWPKAYFTRSWEMRETARDRAEHLLHISLALTGDLPRHNLYRRYEHFDA